MELLFGTALVNAWIVYNLINDGNKIPKLQFVEEIIKAFTKKDFDNDTGNFNAHENACTHIHILIQSTHIYK